MKHLIVIGIFAWIFCTGLRYYSWSKYHEGSQASSLLTFLPKSRDDALLFAIQFASLLEILIGVLYGLFRLDLYISKPLVYGVISQLLPTFRT